MAVSTVSCLVQSAIRTLRPNIATWFIVEVPVLLIYRAPLLRIIVLVKHSISSPNSGIGTFIVFSIPSLPLPNNGLCHLVEVLDMPNNLAMQVAVQSNMLRNH